MFQSENLVEDIVRFRSAKVVKLIYPRSLGGSSSHIVNNLVEPREMLPKFDRRNPSRGVQLVALLHRAQDLEGERGLATSRRPLNKKHVPWRLQEL